MSQFKRISNARVRPIFNPSDARSINIRLPIGASYKGGTVLGQVNNSGTARSEVKTLTITGTPTGGTWAFTIGGVTSGNIPYNATAAVAQPFFDAVFGAGNTVVTGGQLPGTALTVTFAAQCQNVKVLNPTTSNALTGGATPTVAFASTTVGNAGAGQYDLYASGNSDGTQVARVILEDDYVSDPIGGMQTEVGSSSAPFSPPAYIKGEFLCSQLTGIDATAVTGLGRLIVGSAVTDAGAVISMT